MMMTTMVIVTLMMMGMMVMMITTMMRTDHSKGKPVSHPLGLQQFAHYFGAFMIIDESLNLNFDLVRYQYQYHLVTSGSSSDSGKL